MRLLQFTSQPVICRRRCWVAGWVFRKRSPQNGLILCEDPPSRLPRPGLGGDVREFRKWLPETFRNLRLNQVEMARYTPDENRQTIARLVHESENQCLTGICCIKMDTTVPDSNITSIFETSEELRREYSKK